jgi:hypothetical protein
VGGLWRAVVMLRRSAARSSRSMPVAAVPGLVATSPLSARRAPFGGADDQPAADAV